VHKSLLSEAIDRAVRRHGFELGAFVYMPEHVHLLVHARGPDYDIAKLLYAIKKPCSERIKRHLQQTDSRMLEQLTATGTRRKTTFRFWQKGPGYDRNVILDGTLLVEAEYLHNNPVRRRLVDSPDQWKWSSWQYYHCPHSVPAPGLPRINGLPL